MRPLNQEPIRGYFFDVSLIFRTLSPWLRPGEPMFNPRRPINKLEGNLLHSWLDYQITEMFGFSPDFFHSSQLSIDIASLRLDTQDFNHSAKEQLFYAISELKLVNIYTFRSTLSATTYGLFV